MALGKYSRVDGRRSSSYCSTVTIVVFVALALIGVWMMTSSSVVPVQKVVPRESKNEVKEQTEVREQVSETDNSNARQFEDNPGDLPEDATKGDSNVSSEEKSEENSTEKSSEDTKTEDEGKKTEDEGSNTENNKDSEEASTKESESDESEKKDESEENNKSDSDESEKKSSDSNETTDSNVEEKVEQSENKESDENAGEKNTDDNAKDQSSNEVFPSGAQSELLNETTTQTGSFSTQAAESKNEKEIQESSKTGYNWKVCNVTAGPDFIPCLDNWKAIRSLRSTKHYEHRERHCPEEPPTCLVSLPEGYKRSIEWPKSREKIWYYNVPHTKLAEVKGHQNWVKVTGEYLTFPGGGTQFKHGALHYIDFIQETLPDIAWGKRTRVILDVGCGVASFGGFLFDRDVLAMSLAPKDEHEAQVQFALERGIPAISAVMGTKRLPFPGRVFDAVHCARCRVPWHIEVIENGLCKQLCFKMFPAISDVIHSIEVDDMIEPVSNMLQGYRNSECLKRSNKAYAVLAFDLSLYVKNCISEAVVASSTNIDPEESIQNTLEPGDRTDNRPSYWLSKGHTAQEVPETLVYKLCSSPSFIMTEIRNMSVVVI